MLNGRRLQITLGVLLSVAGVIAVGLAGARANARDNQRHVKVRISNVDGTVQLAVGCEQATEVSTGEIREVDLGWMPPDTQIFISVASFDRHPAWAYRIISNGEVIGEGRRGVAKTLAPGAVATKVDAIVYARDYTAGGDRLGSIGCQEPAVVSRSDVPGYLQSPAERRAGAAEAEESSFQPRHSYDRIDAFGNLSLPALSLMGIVVALLTPFARRLAWSHKRALATGALAILGAGIFQLDALPEVLTIAGTLLFFAVATFLLVGEARTLRWFPQLSGPGRGSRRS